MITHWNAQISINTRNYPHLPDWYQRKMKFIKTTTSSIWEEINPVWYYLGA